jgi:copper chaperone CopZ
MTASVTINNSLGTDVTANYNITYATNTGGVIRLATVTVTAVTDKKIYDGTVSSMAKPIVGMLVAGDTVNLAPIQKFDNVTVGNTHVLIASGLTIKKISTGEDVTANYNINYANSSNDGVILGKPTTAANPKITESKVYDGSTSAVVIPGTLSGVDVLDIPNVVLTAIATYDNANTGTGKTITVTYGLSGSAASIYATPSNFSITTGEITAKPLTVSNPIIISSKIYDGNTSTGVTSGNLSGVDAADVANVNLVSVATYDNANVGTGKTINVTYGLSGSAATNYIAPIAYSVTNGVITGKQLTVISMQLATSKVYDGTTTVNFVVGNLSGLIKADSTNVLLTGLATYDNPNAGTGKTISLIFNISGTASGNYLVPISYNITNGNILPKLLTISDPVVVKDKLVDGNTTAVITSIGSLQGVEATDVNNLTITATADYNNNTVGIDKTITVVYALNGSAKGNYLAPANFVITGAIITDNLTLSPTITSTSGCEGSSLDLNYTVLTGTPTQYKITFSASTLAAGIQNINYTDLPTNLTNGVLPVLIPKGTKYGIYQGTLQMKNELGIESPVYSFEFTINVSSDYIIPKFDDVVLCDNSSNLFVGYQWYKNGVAIDGATKQFYNDLDGLIGSYSLRVITTNKDTLYTCSKELNIPLIKKLSVFPSPLKVNQPCTVKLTGMSDTELEGSEMSVYSVQGIIVYHSTKVERLNSIYLPAIDGMYLGNVTTKDGQVFPFKVIVTK